MLNDRRGDDNKLITKRVKPLVECDGVMAGCEDDGDDDDDGVYGGYVCI